MTFTRMTDLREFDASAVIRAAREHASLSQAALAALVGATQSAVSRWEAGVDEPRLARVADVLQACGLESSITVQTPDVDRAQIRQQLAMSPEQRLESVANVSRLRATARRA